MNMLFGLDYEHFCIVYMDDLLIFSHNADEHKYHVRQVFCVFAKVGGMSNAVNVRFSYRKPSS